VGTVLAANGGTCSFAADFDIPAGDYPGSHINTFTATATDPDGNVSEASEPEEVTYTDVLPDITVLKTAEPSSVPETGGQVTFTYVVTNNATEAAEITSLSDDRFGALAGDDDCAVGTALQPGTSCSFEVIFTIPPGVAKGTHVNTFTAAATDDDGNGGTADDPETVTYEDVLPDISVTKTANPVSIPESGGMVAFTYLVRNIGTVPATITSLTDDKFGPLTGDGDCAVGIILQPGTSCEFTASFNVPAGDYPNKHVNTFTVVAADADGNLASDSATAEVTYIDVPTNANLTVSKTAIPTFTRTFNWSISKAVDKLFVRQIGGNAVFNYTVVVNQTGFTDSLWKVTGKITVTNPNAVDFDGVDVTDEIDNGGVCAVVGGEDITVLAGGSVALDYTCAYASAPMDYSGANTATATWPTGYGTPNTSATNTANFAFDDGAAGNPTNVNKTINVTDTMTSFATLTLGTVEGKTTTPFATKTFTYSRTIAVPSFDCKEYTNTAKIVETGQTDSKTVKVCGPRNLGGKTIGFWSNKNGQDIIKKAGAVGGICKLTPFLRQYAPFQDLSATASCTTVNTYVQNVIKAANASGAAMNPMLKAQMLASALDVYFSDPALGGNKIGAPAPLGSQVIDLTYIKWGGGYQNVSAAFGGATSLTVNQMLIYVASQSNVGGTTWYGQVKATQEMAKNAFDAINNNWTFPPLP
jgi:hypothetical protein